MQTRDIDGLVLPIRYMYDEMMLTSQQGIPCVRECDSPFGNLIHILKKKNS